MSRVLVIGGTGLISGSVTGALLAAGVEVTIFTRGQRPSDWGERAPHLLIGDRTERAAFSDLVRQHGPWDCVIDMICSDPQDAQALRSGCRGNATQVIFCSTTNVYPKPATRYPVPESHLLGAAYKNGIDKAACEALHRQAEAAGDYRVTIIRPGHTFGEGGGILHTFGQVTSYLDRLRQGKPIIVHGDGQSLWSCLHADDVGAIFAAAVGTHASGSTYNACGLDWMTWDQYHLAVADAIGAPEPTLVHISTDMLLRLAPQRANHVGRSLQYPGIYDMTAACRDLGFVPQVNFARAVQRTVTWLEEHDRLEPWQQDSEYEQVLAHWQALEAQLPQGQP